MEQLGARAGPSASRRSCSRRSTCSRSTRRTLAAGSGSSSSARAPARRAARSYALVSDALRPEPMAEAERHARLPEADGGRVGHPHRRGHRAHHRSAGPCRLVEPLELAPGLPATPLRPGRDLAPIPQPALSLAPDRIGEARLVGWRRGWGYVRGAHRVSARVATRRDSQQLENGGRIFGCQRARGRRCGKRCPGQPSFCGRCHRSDISPRRRPSPRYLGG